VFPAFAGVSIRSDRTLAPAFAGLSLSLDRAPSHVDRGGIEHRLDVGGVEFLDHLDARAAVLGNLVDVGALHQAKADRCGAGCRWCGHCLHDRA
jgi:hypothetical protein